MDQEDADSIYQKLMELESNNKHSWDLLQEQTSVIKSNFETLRKPIENMTEEISEIQNFVNEISSLNNERIAQLEKANELLLTRMAINELTSNITVQLQEWDHQLASTTAILTALNAGKLHPNVLSYHQLTAHLKNISNMQHIHNFLNDPFLLQQLASVSSFNLNNVVFIKIVIPLPQMERFNLKKIYYLPVPIAETVYGIYDRNEGYLAVDEGKNSFILPQQTDIDTSCTKKWFNLTSSVTICKLNNPIITSPSHNCILLLYKSWSEASNYCTTTQIHLQQDILIKLIKPNNWIYILASDRDIKIQCRQFTTTIRKKGQGILRLSPTCKAQIQEVQLLADNIFDSEVLIEQPDLTPKWTLSKAITGIVSQNNYTGLPKLRVMSADSHHSWLLEGRERIAHLERRIKDEQDRKNEQSKKIKENTFFGLTATLGIGLAVCAFIVFRVTRTCDCSRTKAFRSSKNTVKTTIIDLPERVNDKRPLREEVNESQKSNILINQTESNRPRSEPLQLSQINLNLE